MIRLTDALRYAAKSLTERRLRATLTIIGIAIGPLALVMITSVTQGYSKYIITQIASLGQNLIVVTPSGDYDLTEDDLDYMRLLYGVDGAEPFYSTRGQLRTPYGKKDVYIYAVPLDFLFKAIPNLKILEGGIPPRTDVVRGIIGYNIAFDDNGRRIYSVGDVVTLTVYKVKPGGKVEVKRISILVAGILDKYGGAMFLSPDDTIFLNLKAAERLIGLSKWSGILVLAKDSSLVDNITQTIRRVYGNSVDIISFLAIARIASSITHAVNFMTFAASLAAFAVAIAGVAATMITSVVERTREIGVLKALGFTDKQVLMLILTEGIIMSLIGAVIGITIGSFGAYILASKGLVLRGSMTTIVIKASPEITPETIARTLGLTVLVGILGSIFPAYRAAKIPPATALRYE